jgi:hypothetical protein
VENMTASSILTLFTHVPKASPEGPYQYCLFRGAC